MSRDILFQLLRIAFNGSQEHLPQTINWTEVMAMAARQGVLGVCFETLEHLPSDQRPDMETLMDWLGQTSYIEAQYENHLALAKEFCEKWASQGVRTMVFKGLAHSRYYPNPTHREFGDFDCYVFDDVNLDLNLNSNADSAFVRSNRLAREMGASVDDSWYKHSKIQYKDLTVENHRYFTAVRSSRRAKALNSYMVAQLGDGSYLEKLEGTDILLPTLEVEGLFMLYHSLRHFLEEGVTIKHFCDWACWINANQNKIVWGSFYQKCKEFGLDGYVDVLNNIVNRYLGIITPETKELRNQETYTKLADKVVHNTLYDETSIHNKGKGRLYERYHLITNSIKYSWKYREVAGYSMIGYLWEYAKGFVFREDED